MYKIMSPLVHWVALRFCDLQAVGSIPVVDGQGYELFGEIAYMKISIDDV